MSETAQQLHDAEPTAWRGEKRPESAPERMRYDAAVIARDAIGYRLSQWEGPRQGPQYEPLIQEWVKADTEANKAYAAMIAAEMNRQTGAAA